MFDELEVKDENKGVAESVVYELPKPGERRLKATTYLLNDRDWAPIRIKVSAEDLKNESMYCKAAGEKRPNFLGELVECEETDVITEAKKNDLLKTILPEAIKLHADRLLVKPVPGPVVVSVPSKGVCPHFTVPEEHMTRGVNLTDFVLYVAAGPGATFTSICSEESIEDRPFSAVMNFEPARILPTRYAVRIAAHEIAHALGFSFRRMRELEMTDYFDFPGEKIKYQVNSKMTRNVSQRHYNCEESRGAFLEEEGGTWNMVSHWERRDAKDELMSVYFDLPGAMLYTAFTMAAFEDMKYFRANWGKEETMSWGKDAGCEFQYINCVEDKKSTYPSMFCNSTSETLKCTSDRFALGECSLTTYNNDLPLKYRYFLRARKEAGSAETLTDRCPIIAPTAATVCTNGKEESMPGSRVG
ncbi:surface protease GP63, partial [Trypanosoma theileri]